MQLWAKGCAWGWGMRIIVEGTPPPPPYLLASNHLSYCDILLIASQCPGRFVSKEDVASWPGIGLLSRLAGTLFIDRTRRQDVSRAFASVTQALEAGDGVILFPEGRTGNGVELEPFKASLLQACPAAERPLHLAVISYHPRDNAPHPVWFEGDPFLDHALNLLAGPGFEARIHFLPEALPYELGRKPLCRQAEQIIGEAYQERLRPS